MFALFVAVGLDKIQKPLHFSVAAGSYFFLLAAFHFIPQFAVLLFLVIVLGEQFGLLLFQQPVFKIIPAFAVLAFCCGSFGWTVLVCL